MKYDGFINRYLWAIILILITIIVIPYDFPRPTGQFTLETEFKPTPNQYPIILLHVSDLHLSSIKPKSYPYIKNILSVSKYLFKPDLLVIAGDVIDNYNDPKLKFHHYHQLNINDWFLYEKLLLELNITIVPSSNLQLKLDSQKNYGQEKLSSIQVFGNHDYYLVDSFTSPQNYMKQIVDYQTIDEFELSTSRITFSMNGSDVKIKFIKLNRVSFPTGPISLHQNSYLTPRFKKRFLKEIAEDTNDTMNIVVSHTPVLKYFYFKTMMSLVKKSKKTRFYLTGHWHPQIGFFQHFGRKSFETVSPGLFKKPYGDVVIIDNGVSSNHVINLNQTTTAVITHPAPNDQKSELDCYSPQTGQIRAVAFGAGANQLNLSVLIDDSPGRLNCSEFEYKENVFLCTLPYSNLENGIHLITKVGDWSGSFYFSIGPKSPSIVEIDYIYETEVLWTVLFILSWLFAIFILSPLYYNSSHNTHNSLTINIYETDNLIIRKIKRSFIHIKSRIISLPSYFYYPLAIGILWSLFLPICAFDTKDQPAFFHTLGNFFVLRNNDIDIIPDGGLQNFLVRNVEYRYHYYGAMYGVYFMYFHLFPIFLMISCSFSYQITKNKFYVLIDCSLFLLSLWGGYYQFTWLIEMFGFFYAITSPLMFWFPLLYYILLAYWTFAESKRNDYESNDGFQCLLNQLDHRLQISIYIIYYI